MAQAPVISVTRAVAVRHYAEHFQSMGAPVGQLLENAGIPHDYLEIPDSLISLKNAYKFLESVCHSLHTEHPGLELGLVSSPGNFGSYGQLLEKSPTVGIYLETGVALYNTLTTGERYWLSEHDSSVRLNIASPWRVGLGMYQTHLCVIAVVIGVCKRAAGPSFSPAEIGLAYRSREKFPALSLFADTRLVCGLPHSYVSIPRPVLNLRLTSAATSKNETSSVLKPLPGKLIGLLEEQIEALISYSGNLHIETVSESLGMSKRTLQRALAHEGLSYSGILSDLRLRRAMDWLDNTDRPVTEIALALGYTDVSNFARAFRRCAGISPRAFRKAASPSAATSIN